LCVLEIWQSHYTDVVSILYKVTVAYYIIINFSKECAALSL